MVKAAENDRDQVIDTLLRNGPISIEDRGRAVVKASSLDGPNTLRIIEMLLENGAQISEDNRGEAVINAARNGHVDIVETLLQNGPISDWYREWAVINAARTGHVDVIEMLLRNGSIREDYRGEAVMKAAGNGNVQVIDTLLQSGPISEDHRGRAVMKAARFGHVQVIDTLLRNGPISIQDRGWAVVYAAQCQNPYLIQGTIERLLQNGQISDMHRGSAVVHVATRGHVDVIEMLLLNGQINDEDRRSAVLNAAQNGHFRIIDRLLEGGARIPRNARNEAVGIDVPSRYFHVPTWEDLENNPLGYLKSFVEIGPSPILFGNGRAVDLGGVTKDFVTRLVNSLKEKKLICADDELGFGDWVSLPVAKNKEQEEALGLFGRLLTHLYMRNCDRRDKIMIPKILDPHLFAVMLAGEGNELVTLDSSEKLQDIWKNPSTASDDLISFVKAGVDFEGENKPFMHAFCEWKASVQKGLRLLKAGIGHPLTAAMETQEG
ncbi:ankyrin repeat domain-containing protein [bacterium]|nr:ankyrin repeat domain-containing protein [bacterium]